ncbi:major facilitator superfamily domain-containing protein [Pisolithus orientalis]|uniref:major facilitator superfamily domain-containing protein n=1 Tax=Pisolithus orientalis TaxID=936130 RepID=UPI0022241B1E|nr:major facilitator superfamily domain-containing protein [Pisolithus orientalis]KAI5994577.1 major facilitator superfamily domain-containing protein [Pisolithus orientalis]
MMLGGYRRLPIEPSDSGDEDMLSHSSEVGDDTISIVELEEEAHVGVKKVEAALQVYGRYSRWVLFASLALASFVYALDSSTTPAYLTFATSSFGEHSLIGAITVVQSLIVAVGKPVIAKIADVSSRGTAYVTVLCFYALGYSVIASAPSVGVIAGGIILYAIGNTGLQLLTQIVIADITTLTWRGLVVSLASTPFIINAFVGPNISSAVIEHLGWRWGYGMFAILMPLVLAPLITTLLWGERKAKKLALVDSLLSRTRSRARSLSRYSQTTRSSKDTRQFSYDILKQRFQRIAEQLDLVGLILLGAAISLILLPLTMSVSGSLRSGPIIAMLIVGVVLLGIFAYWDIRVAKIPVFAPRFMRNTSVIIAALIGFFDFMSFYLTYTYLYSFVLVVKPWSLVNATYFMQAQSVALTFSGIIAGICMRYFHRYKYVLITGLIVRFAGVTMMIYSRGANSSDAELVATQILQGLGGGLAAVSSQVGAQASVTHADVAIITALVLLLTEIGGAAGNACAGAIWSNTMPRNLEKYLPWLTDVQRADLYGSITSVTSLPRGNPVREGAIQAYDDTMKVMVIAAVVVSVLPMLLALGMPNWYLGDKQNAVDAADLDGRKSVETEVGSNETRNVNGGDTSRMGDPAP